MNAHAVFGKPDPGPSVQDYWNATGRVAIVNESNGDVWGLEGDLLQPQNPYPGWYAPIHVRLVRINTKQITELTIRLNQTGETRAITDAQIVNEGFIMAWQDVSSITVIRLENPIFSAIRTSERRLVQMFPRFRPF
ncbi:hypothetical protein [Kribbella sp. NPDC023855]|uniref:hypothetical protein n=1 Tax=Kribbella sp. NPDC023855 TaxID=3154698 RepID=UPI0033F4FEA7